MTSTERLIPVPLRELWPREAVDFTPWLADNIDMLGDELGMTFDPATTETEVAVERFSADVVAVNDQAEKVVVENFLDPSDHRHLGQLITYAAGLDASHAVLVAESLRDEHRTALGWLNNIAAGVGFFGVEVTAWRIGQSPIAPQLRAVVEPDNWRRTVRVTTGSGLGATYARFWAGLLPLVHEAEPRWRGTKTPQPEGMMSFKAAIPSVKYLTRAARSRLTAQCYIDTGDADTTREVYDHLHDRRDVIEEAFGAPLKWRPLDGARASTIDADFPGDVNIEDRDRWPDMWQWLVPTMGRLADAIDPHLR